MLVCLPLEEKKINSLLSVQFEEAKYFFLVETESKEMEVVENLALGDEVVYLITAKKPKAVITGNLLPASFDFLEASGIKIDTGIFGQTGKEALENFKKGKLRPAVRKLL